MAKRLLIVGATALALVGADLAAASKNLDYEGRTERGREAFVRATPDGIPREVQLTWRASKCTREGVYLDSGSSLIYRLDGPSSRLNLGGRYKQRLEDGFTAVINTSGHANLSANREHWTGTFNAKAILKRNGRRYDRCKTGSLKWKTSLVKEDLVVSGGMNAQSEPGDTVGDGESYTATFPEDREYASIAGNGGLVRFTGGPFGGFLSAGAGKLKPGITYEATDSGGGPKMDIQRGTNVCGDTNGVFTINKLAHRGDEVRSLAFTFEQRCDADTAALRGDFTYELSAPPFDVLRTQAGVRRIGIRLMPLKKFD